jgi:hypothetical protein
MGRCIAELSGARETGRVGVDPGDAAQRELVVAVQLDE